MWGLWHFHLSQGACQTARDLGDELLTLAEQRGDPMLLVAAHQALGRSLYHLGDFAAALFHLEQARAGFEQQVRPSASSALRRRSRRAVHGYPVKCSCGALAIRIRPCSAAVKQFARPGSFRT